MKRVISLFLALALMLSSAYTAYAMSRILNGASNKIWMVPRTSEIRQLEK